MTKLDSDTHIFLLYNIELNIPIGYIGFGYSGDINSYTVYGAFSKRGFGPFLYESAMTHVYPNGLSMTRDSGISMDAINVWERFLEGGDVRNERIRFNGITHKRKDWVESGFLDNNKEYRNFIFSLEDTRFYYSYGKNKLNKLIDNSKRYQMRNNITHKDIEYMTWDLE